MRLYMQTTLVVTTLFTAAALISTMAAAQGDSKPAAQTGASRNAEMADGEVRKIDRDAKKVTLKHGEIKSLEMTPMTMVFQVRDVSILEGLKPGDKVRFVAEQVKNAYIVTRIEAVK